MDKTAILFVRRKLKIAEKLRILLENLFGMFTARDAVSIM